MYTCFLFELLCVGGPDRTVTILDMGVIDQMGEDTGDESIPMLIDVFKEEVPMRVSNIVATLKEQSLDMLGREAHTLKSTSGSFGAMQFNP